MWQHILVELLYEQARADWERARRRALHLQLRPPPPGPGLRGRAARALVRAGLRLDRDVAASTLTPLAGRSAER